MSKIKFSLVISILILTTACSTLSSPTPATGNIPLSEADVPRITVEEAKAAVESGAAIIVDVRSKEAFANSHIPGAVNIFLQEFETNIAGVDLDKEQWIFTYCT